MVAIKALTSFCTYVGNNCVTAHEGSTVFLPKTKANELVAGGLAVLVEDAPPVPPQTKVSSFAPPAADATKTHEQPPADPEPEGVEQPPADPPSVASPPKQPRRAPMKRAASKRTTKPKGESHGT